MKSFESVYKELEDLFIKQLPDYIEKVNKSHNDGNILKSFENIRLDEECLQHPCFKFKLESTEYSDKDRIIENEKYTFSIEIKLEPHIVNKYIFISRYVESVDNMISDVDTWQDIVITGVKENTIYIQITV